ncbi:hypothetical protein [Mesorhizobium amorphae]|uniref:hypothetical protein n=1 Tax=Mesorhizobium amorphae TaxID=71433 RepID=UPI00177EF5EC|nr:hypothetical protein [Mesorhizobium amorphae]
MSLKDFLAKNEPAKLTLATVQAEIDRLSAKAEDFEYNHWNSGAHIDAAKLIRREIDTLRGFKARLLADLPPISTHEKDKHYQKGAVLVDASGVVWEAGRPTWDRPETKSDDWQPIIGTPAEPEAVVQRQVAPKAKKRTKATKGKTEADEAEEQVYQAEVDETFNALIEDLGFEDLARPLSTRMTVSLVAQVLTILDRACSRINKRVDEIGSRPGLTYRGVFRADVTYRLGDVTTHAGSAWHCCIESVTGVCPGDGQAMWQLMVKRGQNGKDARP